MHAKREDILAYLRDHGRGTVEDLARHVGLAPVTVRHHLHVLRDAGHVESDAETVGRGRPRHVFRLSPSGAEALQDGHSYAALVANLIDAIHDEPGVEAQRVLRSVAARMAASRAADYEGQGMEDRLEVLCELLADEGFVVAWAREGDAYVIREVGCPYRSVSATHADVCEIDLELIRLVTGAEVSRGEWRGDGGAKCAFRVPCEPGGGRER
jgi:predicted ArsR family transcriptional regulator